MFDPDCSREARCLKGTVIESAVSSSTTNLNADSGENALQILAISCRGLWTLRAKASPSASRSFTRVKRRASHRGHGGHGGRK